MQTVHVRVNDAATGKPTPCRVRFTDAAGTYYAPLGRCSDFPSNLSSFAEGNVQDSRLHVLANVLGPMGNKSLSKAQDVSESWAYVDGSFEIDLPPGPIYVRICKGFEYFPLGIKTELLAGKLAMRFALERWTDQRWPEWRNLGWYAGDGRVHNASPHEALLQAAGEDLAIVNLLVEEIESGLKPNIVAFSGQKPCLEMPGHMVVVNTHNVYPEMGNLALLNCHRVVYPLRLCHKGEAEWTLADWCDQCHRKQGLVVWTVDPDKRDPFETEALACLALGKVDAFEIAARPILGHQMPEAEQNWYTLLDAGYRVPLIGSSGSRTNGQLLGQPRTYCKLAPGELLTYRSWIEAVRAGRTFVTEGPLIHFTVNGQSPGSVLDLSGNEKTVLVHAEVHSMLPLTNLEILCNGAPVAQANSNNDQVQAGLEFPWRAELTQDIPVPDGGWLSAHVRGPNLLLGRSSPVYVEVPGRKPPQRQRARELVARSLIALRKRAQKNSNVNKRLEHVLQSACDHLGEPGA